MTSSSTDRLFGANSSVAIKAPCRVATTANITLSGNQSIDGVTTATGDRVLVKNQTDTTENGIYIADSSAWERSPDFDGNRDIVTGSLVTVVAGSTLSDTAWRVTTANPIVVDTSSIAFEQAIFSDADSISFTAAGAGAVQRTMQSKERDIVSVKDFGAVGDGATNDTVAFQAAHDSLGTNGILLIPAGTYLLASWRITKSDITILCLGVLQPATTSSTAVIIGKNASGQTVATRRLKGNLRVDSGSTFATYSGATGILVEYLTESQMRFSVSGCNKGVSYAPDFVTGGGTTIGYVAYNEISYGDMVNNKIAVEIDPLDATSSVNENQHYGGRFTINSGTFTTAVIYHKITAGAGNTPNNNRFLFPSFEGAGKCVDCDSSYNYWIGVREEVTTTGTAGVDYAQPYVEFHDGGSFCQYHIGYGLSNFVSGMVDHGAGTRTNDRTFTIASDLTAYFYPGAYILLTVSGTDYFVPVVSSSYSNPTMTVRVGSPIVTAGPTACKTPPVKVHGSAIPFIYRNETAALTGIGNNSIEARQRQRMALLRSALEISGLTTDYPALSLYPGGSSSEKGLSIFDFTQRTASIDHDGNIVTLGGLNVGTDTSNQGFTLNDHPIFVDSVSLADDATGTISMPSTAANFIVILTNFAETCSFVGFNFSTALYGGLTGGAGTVSVGTAGANPDVDGDMNVWMSSASVLSIKNRLGSIRIFYVYAFGRND